MKEIIANPEMIWTLCRNQANKPAENLLNISRLTRDSNPIYGKRRHSESAGKSAESTGKSTENPEMSAETQKPVCKYLHIFTC